MSTSSDSFRIYGTHALEQKPIRLTAGRLTADLSDGNLRTIAYDGVEVLRAVSYLVRDRDWGTYAPDIADLIIEQQGEGFSVRYTAVCKGPDATELAIGVRISAEAGAPLIFEADALSGTGFETNRCGFCILHPIVGVAGAPVTVEHADGRRVETRFPDLIEPWQPFMNMSAITHTVMTNVTARCGMEGDVFEMEDQRNWSDASYKTYVRPLALPWPYQIPAGETVKQRIVLDIADKRPNTSATTTNGHSSPTTLTLGERRGRMPAIGVIVTPEEADAVVRASAVLGEIRPQELLFHFDPTAGHGAAAFERFAEVAKRHSGTSTLEIALPCTQPLLDEPSLIATQMRDAGFKPDAIIISPSVDRQSTPPGSKWPECPPLEEVYAAAHAAFTDIRVGGGMLSYFTELNRKRVPSAPLSFISHCTNPIVHAADDLSVMQTLEALPFITRSVRAIYGDKPYRIGPSTIPMRQNPYGSRTMDNPKGARIPMANTDPRHNGFFAEAFAMAYIAKVLDAELECLTLSALTGSFGLLAGKDEPFAADGRRPLFNAVKTLAGLAGAEWRECISSNPSHVLAFATKTAAGATLWIINITANDQEVDLGSLRLSDALMGGVLTLSPYQATSVALSE
ncbi:hypothetical protein [Rhizobium sp. AN80A]|uniref:D-apionate lactonase n=1 Tax=Rhizobium sp. AN80A TaxID=3040673 RepID=UPI0024B32ADE|nr:hypothetical protein [Rhizobium sp. AN80A]